MSLPHSIKRFWHRLGPGLITGAADDDPSGITTYSYAGAKFGLGILWTSIITIPFMIVVQRMAGRIGLVSGRGLAGNMKKFYPKWLLSVVAIVILTANIVNIGADISGMSAAFSIVVPQVSPILFAAIISGLIIIALILFSYRQIAHYLKWVAIVLFAYILANFFVTQDWLEILKRTFIPQFTWSKEYLLVISAILGTTISPYLFFWQASEAVEEEKMHEEMHKHEVPMMPDITPHPRHRSAGIIRNEIGSMYKDVGYGMFFSNIISFFIITLSSATFFRHGITNINSVEQIASALYPLAGPYANLLFLIGIMASGVLAVPVLAGSAAYALAELFGWKSGFDKKFHAAKQFYIVIIIATLLGILIPALGLHPVTILFYTAVIYGVVSPLMILLLIHMANNPKIMGTYTSRTHSTILAYILFAVMAACVVIPLIL